MKMVLLINPTVAEVEKLKKKGKGRMKRKAQPSDSPRQTKACKTTSKVVKVTFDGKPIQRAAERVETSTMETPVVESNEICIQTPPSSPIHERIPIQTEEVHVTPSQQHQSVQEPGSTTKKTATPRQHDHDADLDATFDIPSFEHDERVEVRLAKLEQDKVASDEKIKNVEAENVVLKTEVLVLNEKVSNLEAANVALNEVVQGLLTNNEQLISANTTLSAENEILRKWQMIWKLIKRSNKGN
ncbi:hypothetical protein Hanom_Chr04g00330061 [Helianthus anomalus]